MTGTASTSRPVREEIARLHLLRKVQLEAVWGWLEHCEVRHLAAAEQLLVAGQANETFYVVLSGQLRVHLDSVHDDPVFRVDPGQTVGEMSVIDDSPASAHVVADVPTRVLAIDEETFWRLVQISHEFAINLLFLLARRMRVGNATIVEGARVRREIEREALIDVLTGLYNRRWLEERLPRLLARHARSGDPLSLLAIDIDHFKRFNDQFGHAAGDAVLRVVGRTISSCLRPTDMGARFGGEEMIVILPDTPLAGAVVAAERLRRVVGELTVQRRDAGALPRVTISIGVSARTEDDTAETLMQRADARLYEAKAGGRNCVRA